MFGVSFSAKQGRGPDRRRCGFAFTPIEEATLTFGVRNIFNTWRTDMSQGYYYSRFNDPALRRYYLTLNMKF